MRDRLLATRLRARGKSVLLLGPRQVGKSTLCRSLGADRYYDLADEGAYLGLAKDPGRLRREILAIGGRGTIVVDEVQRLPALLNSVQSLLDQFPKSLRFVLTGSSAQKLKRGGANLLPGRIVLEHLDPLSVLELGAACDLDRALRLGMLPGVYWGDDEAADVLGTYAEVYLREEISAGALAKSIGAYARFLDVMAVVSGQWINYTKLSSDIEVPKETVRRFIQLLEDTLIAFRLPAYTPRAGVSRRLAQRDRVLLFDVGVRNALLGHHRHRLPADQIGPVFEQWVILQVVTLNRALRKGWKLSSYRTLAGAEVDLVVERDDDIVGIEIKAGRTVSVRDTRGLRSLAELVGRRGKPLRRWIVYRGTSRQRFDDGTDVWPVEAALRELA